MKKRLFIAIDFPLKIKKQIDGVVGELGKKYPQIRWEKEANLHLTLKFLGWTETEEKVIAGMERTTGRIKPFYIQLTNLGYFLKESLIVWLGVKSQGELLKLAENLDREMAEIGFRRERREFSPHITLGRKREAKPIARWRQIATEIQNLKIPQFENFEVKQIVLKEGHLTFSGSTYISVKTQDLPRYR